MKKPFLTLWIPYAIGIFLDYNYDIGQESYRYLLIISVVLFAVSRFLLNKTGYVFLTLLSLSLGGLFFNQDYNRDDGEGQRYGETTELTVRVLKTKAKAEGYERYIVESEETSEKMLLTIYEETELRAGDMANISGEIEELRENTNPKLFSLKDYYRSQYIYSNIKAKSSGIEVVERDSLSMVEKYSEAFKTRVETAIEDSLESEDRALVASMMLGDSSYIDREELQTFRDLGLGHMMAVSGLHIGIIFGAVLFTLKDAVGFHKRIGETVALILIWIYIVLLGVPISSARAGTMITLLVFSKLIHRRYDALNIISFVGLVMILYRPLWALSLGYQLSFAGVIVLSVSDGGKWKKLIAIFLGMVPLNMLYFNTIPLVSIVTNLIVTPILSSSLVASFGVVLAYSTSERLGKLFGSGVDILLFIFRKSIDVIGLYHQKIVAKSPSLVEIIFWYIVILTVLKVVELRRYDIRVLKLFIVYSFIVTVWIAVKPISSAEVSFLDVNQGDCAVIKVGDTVYMVDSGGSIFSDYDVGENVVYPYLIKHGISKLDGFIVSHFDADHVKGFLYIMDNIEVDEIIIGHESPENELYGEIMEKAKANGIPVRLVEKPSVLEIDDENTMTFIPPSETVRASGDENNSSMLLLLELFGSRILFTGDIEEYREAELKSLDTIRDIDILKVPHHGSKTSSTDELLEATKPTVGIIQVGKNSFGHPSPEVMERYRSFQTEIYRNDESGMIKLSIDGDGFVVEEFLRMKTTIQSEIWSYRLEIAIAMMEIYIWMMMIGSYRQSCFSIGTENWRTEVGL